ncbi:MAG: DsbA family protein [Deltaproteobacteria bacterium]|nr:DsbA family protein [Deltaproteobacteria bacterium]
MMKRFFVSLVGFSLLSLYSAQPDELKALRKELESLKQGQSEIQKELQEIKALLRGRVAAPPPEPQNVVLSVKDDPFKGEKNAKITLVEFSDYQCPFCSRHSRDTLPQLEREYIASGKLKYVFRNFPIESIHPQAFKAHEAANCAAEQGKYWEMHDRLFADQKMLAPKDLPIHAQALGLDLPKFQQCVDSGKHASKIRSDLADGQKAGVQGTPTFFLGLTDPSDTKVKAARVIRGAQPYAAFKTAIAGLLAGQK